MNKVALVVGGSSGIGLAIARRFAAEGAETYLTGRRKAELDEAVAQIGGQAHAIQADATDPVQLHATMHRLRTGPGRLDVLVISAGVSENSRLEDITEEHFDRTVGLNLRALLFTMQAAQPLMARGGSVVLIGSIASDLGTEGYGVYGASKAAVRALARTWTTELASAGIRVNVVSPGPVDTAMFAQASDEVRTKLTALIPLGRLARPGEVAAAALFLASEESSFVAGAELCVDGGMSQV